MGRSFPALPLLFVTVLCGGWLHCSTFADHRGLCRRLKFDVVIDGYALKWHVFKNLSLFPVSSIRTACKSQCIMDPACVSVNIGPPTEGRFICELSDSDHTHHPLDVKRREGFMYIGTENPCSSSPCLHNSICLNGYTDKGYLCECLPGYTGEICEKDIDECVTAEEHKCDANADCVNTHGSYNCSCKSGYTGDRLNCSGEIFCVTAEEHKCDANADCVNTHGSYNCSCKSGYTGDGLNCSGFNAVFTNLGASGRFGPASLGGHYTGQDHDGQVTLSGGIQQWTVPYTGDYKIETIGAAGGYDTYSNSDQYQGRGAKMIGTFSLSKGEIIKVLVGQEGGFNKVSTSAGGGGGTFVVRGSYTPLIIAGGGGGIDTAKARETECDASTGTTGNPGYRSWSGGSNGHGAQEANYYHSGGGGGGFYSSGRSSKYFNGTMGYGGEGGKEFFQGGVGGRAKVNNVDGGFGGGGGARGRRGGGGGGGGYSGGGSGSDVWPSCGGGGGSFNNGTNQENDCCYNTAGHGNVTITFLP
ncbi:uncharacterized protein LOC144664690 isoform X2 [Oculina patagonica]